MSATLNATVDPEGEPVGDCRIEYGPTTAYGQDAPCEPAPGTGIVPVDVSASVGGLAANAIYHFRVLATGPGGMSSGSDHAFSTFKTRPGAPAIVGEASAQSFDSASASLSAAGAGDLLVAFVAADGPLEGGQTAVVTSPGLSWSLAARQNAALGDVEIWVARAPAALDGTAVSASLLHTGYDESLTLIAFDGSGGAGNAATSTRTRGAPRGTLKPLAANSWVFAVGNDWLASLPRAVGPAQSLIEEDFDEAGDTFWVQSADEPTLSARKKVKLSDTAPKRDPYNLALVEVL